MNQIKVRSRLWLETEEGTFLGNGRIQLLEQILETESINDAAKNLKMSYRKAWSMLDSMNRISEHKLIEKTTGGQGGGGTIVTEAGKKAIEKFHQLNDACQTFLDSEVKRLNF